MISRRNPHLFARQSPRAQAASMTRFTWTARHWSAPRGVGMPRSVNPLAMAWRDAVPSARSWSITGRRRSAWSFASALRAAMASPRSVAVGV